MDKDYFGKDKLYHFLACFVLSLYSTEMAFSAAFAKEYGDYKSSYNHWCWWDIAFDTIGIIIGTVIRILIIGQWNWI